MRSLNENEINKVNGGIAVTVGIVVGSFVGGYIYGRLTREEPKKEPCKPNEVTGTQCA
ncbi:hypothetical protein HII17_09490 [Thalassotalea sp. M1531]|uniref:Uncharacterized protein n=1 Tax=Thalassotalea algicola TaxID=2716224 RepID=A0A7Y0LC95_9GAMM|nr:hypothetical protein [Thalassotalea algicola]NMP31796.1 hypothetical protein [Thalassotalea algicola]